MERKIGEIFKYNCEWYQTVEAPIDEHSCNGCQGCCMGGSHIFEGECNGNARKDGKFVIFKKLEKVGKPFSCNYYGDGRLVMMQEYQLFNSNVIYCYQTPLMYITGYKHKRIAIEIKQNKKYMEEKKLNLKPFNVQKAREGKPVCTRDGRKARIVCFDRKANTPIVALIECDDHGEILQCVHNDGRCVQFDISDNDLMMLPEKKEGWVNVYRDCDGANITENDNIYSSEEAAIASAQVVNKNGYVATVKIAWEE